MAERTRKITKKVAAKTPRRVVVKNESSSRSITSSIISPFTSIKNRYQRVSPRKRWLTVGVIVALLLLFYFKSLFVVALVNGQPIPRWTVIGELERQNGKNVLNDIITKTLILQEAKKKNITVSQGEIDDQVKKAEDQVKSSGTTLDDALAQQGETRASYMDNIRYGLLLQKLVEKDIAVTDKEISDYLDQNKDTLPKDASPEALKAQAADALKKQKQQQKAQDLLTQLKKDAKINYFLNY